MKQLHTLPFAGVSRQVPDRPPLSFETDDSGVILMRDSMGTIILNTYELDQLYQIVSASEKIRTIAKSLDKYDKVAILKLLGEVQGATT